MSHRRSQQWLLASRSMFQQLRPSLKRPDNRLREPRRGLFHSDSPPQRLVHYGDHPLSNNPPQRPGEPAAHHAHCRFGDAAVAVGEGEAFAACAEP